MAAADSFVGEGLAPSPYSEVVAQRDLLDRLCRVYESVVQEQSDEIVRLKGMVKARALEVLDLKLHQNRLVRDAGRLESDNEFLRQVVSALAEKGKPCGS